MADESRTVPKPDWVIFQIGRLERWAFQKTRFAFKGTEQEAELSSLAVARALASCGEPAAVHIFYPVSLPFNRNLPLDEWQKDPALQELAVQIERAWSHPDAFRQAPELLFKHHPHSWAASRAGHARGLGPHFSVIPSIGAYTLPSPGQKPSGGARQSAPAGGSPEPDQPTIKFQCPPAFIELVMFAEMLSVHHRFEAEGHIPRVYAADISAGHNIYAGTLWSALRYFNVCLQFMHRDQAEQQRPSFHVLVSDPVSPGLPDPVEIHDMQQAVAYFFTFPERARPIVRDGRVSIEAVDSVFGQATEIGGFDHDAMTKLIDEGARAWAALNYGIVALLPYIDASRDKEKEILDAIRDLLAEVSCRSRRVVARNAGGREESLPNWSNSVRLLLIALHIHLAIVRCVRKCTGTLRADGLAEEGDAWRVAQLRDAYENVFRALSENEPSLLARREVKSQIARMSRYSRDQCCDQWQNGSALLENQSSCSSGWDDRRYRNLVAHAGFEHSIYEFRADGNDFLFRYTQEGLERAWQGTYFAMGAVKSARAFRSQVGGNEQRGPGPLSTPQADTQASALEGAGSAAGQFGQEGITAKEAGTRSDQPTRTAVHGTEGVGARPESTETGELAQNPVGRAAELRAAAAEVVADFRKAGLFGPCLYWADVFGVSHGLTSEELREAITPRPPDSPDWRPDYNTVRAIEEANQAIRDGTVHKAEWLCEPIVLVGRIKAGAGKGGVWIEVPGLRDFYAPVAESLDRGCEVGSHVRFRPRVRRHRRTGQPTLMATDCEPIDDQ